MTSRISQRLTHKFQLYNWFDMGTPLYEAWLERIDSYYSEIYAIKIIEAFSQYGGGNSETREGNGKMFGAGYEVFIYAFFIGLYSGIRKPLYGPKKKFRMRMKDWGNVNPNVQKGRKKYTKIQEYIFMVLVAKSDVDFIAIDKGELSVDEACDILMTTLNDYTNQGLYLMNAKMQDDPNFFYSNMGFVDFLKFIINKEESSEFIDSLSINQSLIVEEEKSLDQEQAESSEPIRKIKKKSARWSMGEDKALLEYFNGGIEVSRIAVILDRDETDVIERLVKKGLVQK